MKISKTQNTGRKDAGDAARSPRGKRTARQFVHSLFLAASILLPAALAATACDSPVLWKGISTQNAPSADYVYIKESPKSGHYGSFDSLKLTVTAVSPQGVKLTCSWYRQKENSESEFDPERGDWLPSTNIDYTQDESNPEENVFVYSDTAAGVAPGETATYYYYAKITSPSDPKVEVYSDAARIIVGDLNNSIPLDVHQNGLSGTNWSYDSGQFKFFIEDGGDYTASGKAFQENGMQNSIDIAAGKSVTLTLDSAASGADIAVGAGSSLTLILSGDNKIGTVALNSASSKLFVKKSAE